MTSIPRRYRVPGLTVLSLDSNQQTKTKYDVLHYQDIDQYKAFPTYLQLHVVAPRRNHFPVATTTLRPISPHLPSSQSPIPITQHHQRARSHPPNHGERRLHHTRRGSEAQRLETAGRRKEKEKEEQQQQEATRRLALLRIIIQDLGSAKSSRG